MSGPQIWLCLFTFRPIASKQLNGLTTIDILSWLGGAVVTHPLWVQDVPGSIPGSGKGFYVWIFVLLLLCFYFFVQNTLFIGKYYNSFYNVNLFSILNVLQDLWPIIRVKRYRPSIFKSTRQQFCIWYVYFQQKLNSYSVAKFSIDLPNICYHEYYLPWQPRRRPSNNY